jgi:hypothetical protein
VCKDSLFVEASITRTAGDDYMPAARRLRLFCDQLAPLCPMHKIDYTV